MHPFFRAILINSLLLLVIFQTKAAAQNEQERFDDALQFYQEGRFLNAAHSFSEIDIPEAKLFTGKSFFAAGQYKLSNHYLSEVPSNAPEQVYDDSRYTIALNDFQTGNFGRSLDGLHILKENGTTRNISRSAENFYEETMNYLTIGQRKEAFMQSNIPEVQLELITSSFDWVDRQTAQTLINTLENSLIAMQDSVAVQNLKARASRMRNNPQNNYAPAPEGITYNIGVALPETEDENTLGVSQSMYFGLSLAAEEFNRRNDHQKIALHHANPDADERNPEHVMTNFAWNNNADLIIGPLFSESAYSMTALAEQYQIPLVTPLANSDSLNLDNPYVYQINPTFSQRGRAMARFAVNELGLDSLAIISEKNTPAEEEAHAFRDEATRLGAHFVHIFNKDFEAQGYDVSNITPWFASDTTFVDDPDEFDLKPVDGLFIATGGGGAANLIDLIMTDLEATRSTVTVLGNEEMGYVEMSTRRLQRLDIFYPEIFYTDESREDVTNFKVDYQNLSGMDADRFAFLGYDVASYLFNILEEVQNPARLKDAIKKQPKHSGLTINIDFGNGHVNRGVRIFQLQPEGAIEIE
ncbi:MAG: ABC transporter substrate-binding protein [Balneolales bacterium]